MIDSHSAGGERPLSELNAVDALQGHTYECVHDRFLIAAFGVGELAPLPLPQTAFIIGSAASCCLVFNEAAKLGLLRRPNEALPDSLTAFRRGGDGERGTAPPPSQSSRFR